MIEVKELEFSYVQGENKIPVLQGTNLTVNEGEFIAFLGANGSGKSTLAKHFNGLLKPSKGKVLVDGTDTRDTDKTALIRQKVGYLFQNPENQLVAPTVGEDVAFGPENYCISPDEIKQRVKEALYLVGMQEYFHQPLQFLSGGQKQCVALAGLLATKPNYLILDEPTSMLDPVGKKMVLAIVRKLKSDGYTIIYITHHMDEALLADRIVVLEKGQVLHEGSPQKVMRIEELGSINLQIPPLYRLLTGLKQGGMKVPDNVLTVDELVNYLCS